MEQILTELKGERKNFTIIVGLSAIKRDSKKKKIQERQV